MPSLSAKQESRSVLSLSGMLKATSDAFLQADVNCDKQLSFEEFNQVVPPAVRAGATEATIRELFDAADTDGSGDHQSPLNTTFHHPARSDQRQ